MGKTIMAIGAHHDDIELRAGGTIAKYAKEGWDVIYAIACTTPHYNPSPEQVNTAKYLSTNEVIQLRKKEAKKGAEILGASETHFFDFKSLYWYREGTADRLYPDGKTVTSIDMRYLEEEIPGREFIVTAHRAPGAVDFICNFIINKKADIILTHSADDAHWEHYATALLVAKAVGKLRGEGHDVKLYGWEYGTAKTLNNGFAPSRFVDISSTIDIKCRALEVFKSQFEDHDTTPFCEKARARAKAYGALAGVEFAEPFMDFNLESKGSGMEIFLPGTYDSARAQNGL